MYLGTATECARRRALCPAEASLSTRRPSIWAPRRSVLVGGLYALPRRAWALDGQAPGHRGGVCSSAGFMPCRGEPEHSTAKRLGTAAECARRRALCPAEASL